MTTFFKEHSETAAGGGSTDLRSAADCEAVWSKLETELKQTERTIACLFKAKSTAKSPEAVRDSGVVSALRGNVGQIMTSALCKPLQEVAQDTITETHKPSKRLVYNN